MSSWDMDEGPVIPSTLCALKACRYRDSKEEWKHVSKRNHPKENPTSIQLITWNVDAFANRGHQRMTSALRHIETDVLKCKEDEAPSPSCIMLQEVHVANFSVILEDEWVKDHFIVTPISPKKWESDYGNVTLVSRSVAVVESQLLAFGNSVQGRSAVVVDLKLAAPENTREVIIRVANVHLESLPIGAVARPIQMVILSKFLKQEGIDGGVVAGDMNAIGPSDRTITVDVGMRDAWRKGDKDEQGFTWGYQGGGDYPAARLDKIVYLPRRGYKVEEPSRIGVGVKTGGGDKQSVWASDHYGLVATLRMLR